MGKRKAADADADGAKAKKIADTGVSTQVNPKRVRFLKEGDIGSGPILYW
jgi:hypothetical protein